MIEKILGNFNLGRIIWIIKKRLFLIIIFTAVVGTAVGYYSFKTSYELYSAQISMYIYGDQNYIYDSTADVSSADLTKARNLVPSYTIVLKSNAVLEKVLAKIQVPFTVDDLKGMISSEAVENTAVFYVNVTNPDPYLAMDIANAIAEIAPPEISRVVKSGGVEVIDKATLPEVPYFKTNVIKYTMTGALAGFALSFAWFLFRGLLDTTIRKKHELTDVFKIPVLGDVPNMSESSKKDKENKLLGQDSPFALKESYSAIRTNIMFTGKGDKCPVYVVTSADSSEGKTLNSINLAMSFSMMGRKTLLIDADLRNPSINRRVWPEKEIFADQEIGLSHYLSGLSEEVNIKNTSGNLYILCAGKIPPNPAELIASIRFEQLINRLKKEFDYIFIDTPPVGIVSDALALSKFITGFIMVVRSNVSKIDVQKRTILQLEEVGANISGFVYNAVNPKSNEYVYKHYMDGYSTDNKKRKKAS